MPPRIVASIALAFVVLLVHSHARLPVVRTPESISLADVIAQISNKQFPDIFIHQEHEGNLAMTDPRDSWGSVFTYYRAEPVIPELIEQAAKGMWWPDRTIYWIKRKLSGDTWEALPISGKIAYLKLLERRQGAACWSGTTCKLLVRKRSAPVHIDTHPRMEAPPGSSAEARGNFLHPEIVTAKDSPALTVNQAIDRAKTIVTATGHAGVHFHVFMRIPPERLRAQTKALGQTLQLLNDAYFLDAAHGNYINITHPTLHPWHLGRTWTVHGIIGDGAHDPHAPDWSNPSNEKSVNVAFRYWGVEDGKMIVSFELRGASIGWTPLKKREGTNVVGDVHIEEYPRRDYAPLLRHLTLLVLIAESFVEGRAAETLIPDRSLDLPRAERLIRERAKLRGLQPSQFLGLAEMAKVMTGVDSVPQGFLVPFADSNKGLNDRALAKFIDDYLEIAYEARHLKDPAENERNFQYRYWAAYRKWVEAELPAVKAMVHQILLGAYSPGQQTSAVRTQPVAVKDSCPEALSKFVPPPVRR